MSYSGTIEHVGVISGISEKTIRVSVMPETACGNCRAKGSCSIGNSGEKTIDVPRPPGETFNTGEQINVVLEQSLGMKALGLGYFLPFLAVLSFLILLTSVGVNEGLAGLLSLAVLVPYYTGLSFFRDSLKKEFSFRLRKI
jgi:sigma-E factor negative regulatory protein RseC